MSGNLRRKRPERVKIASRKEWVYLTVLIFLAVATGTYLFYLVSNPQRVKNTGNNDEIVVDSNELITDEGKNARDIQPFPFEEKEHIVKDTTDSKYLTTEGYYYFIHKILVMSEEEILKATDTNLGWQDLVKMGKRDTIRGKFMNVRGSLVENPKREIIKGTYAEERGFTDLVVWTGAISSIDGRLFLFTTTELNQKAKRGDAVELNGIFYKIWIYENRGGLESKHPYFIGKKIQILEQVEPTQHKKMTIVFLIFFAIVCILLGYGIVNERQEANKFWNDYSQRRMQRIKKKRGDQADKASETEQEPEEASGIDSEDKPMNDENET